MTTAWSVAVIGAGMAGLACAGVLQQAGCAVTLFDKSRGPGGRLATRRGDGWQCDHGAPYFTATDPAFMAEVQVWAAAGAVAPWRPRGATETGAGDGGAGEPSERWVGVPGMSALARHLTDRLMQTQMQTQIQAQTQLQAQTQAQAPAGPTARFAALPVSVALQHTVLPLAARAGNAWPLDTAEHGRLAAPFDTVLLAVPAPQARALLASAAPALAALAGQAVMQPCWTLMLQFGHPAALPFDAAVPADGPLQLVARNSSKPGRDGTETWVLHARPGWSASHIEDHPDAVAAALLPAWAALGGPPPAAWVAHRWRYAGTAPHNPGAAHCAWDPALRLGLCGDWMAGGNVQGAWLGGRRLARQVLAP